MASKLISEDALKMYPACAPNGVYILSTDGKLYDPNTWTSGTENAVGVALIADDCRIVISPDEEKTLPWYNDSNVLIPNVFTSNDMEIAKFDFGGQENTHAAVGYLSQLEDADIGPDDLTASALGYCAQYTFKNGKHGYLGSVGEWMTIIKHEAQIDNALSKIGSWLSHGTIDGTPYWTSTQSQAKAAYAVKTLINDNMPKIISKNDRCLVKPLCKLD